MFEPSFLFVLLSVTLLGIAKGGFGGVGTPIALPLMALGVSPDVALGALLPLLIAMDVVSVTAHRQNADLRAVGFGLPGAVLGVILGALVIALVSAGLIGGTIGVLAIVFGVMGVTGYMPRIQHWPEWTNSVFGALSGFTSTLAHAGGPPIQIYYLSRGYSPAAFVATSATFMAGVNLIKIIPFFVVGALNSEALWLALTLAPLALLSAGLGVWVARRISKGVFRFWVNGLMIAVGAKLLFDAVIA